MSRPILLLATLLWFFGSAWFYVCKIKQVCPSNEKSKEPESIVAPIEKSVPALPISYDYNSATDLLTDNFTVFRDSIISTLGENEQLQITGFFDTNEENNTTYENLGLARAAAARLRFEPPLDIDKIDIRGEANSDAISTDARFMGLRFAKYEHKTVQKFDDKVVINFPVASANMIQNPEVDTYMNELAAHLKTNPNTSIQIIGHTDNTASEEVNYEWGLRRANAIAGILKSKGVPNKQYRVVSKGELDPISTNSTQIGRQQNRRVELIIND